jgi:hypothetical protein
MATRPTLVCSLQHPDDPETLRFHPDFHAKDEHALKDQMQAETAPSSLPALTQ